MSNDEKKPRELSPEQKARLDNEFTYHKPFGDQPARYVEIRSAARLLAETVMLNTPPSAEQSIALRKIREASQWANAAIAINEIEPVEAVVPEKGESTEQPAAEPAPAQ